MQRILDNLRNLQAWSVGEVLRWTSSSSPSSSLSSLLSKLEND